MSSEACLAAGDVGTRLRASQATSYPVCFESLPEEQRENKMKSVREGGELMESQELFPARRTCSDYLWAVLFLFTLVIGLVGAVLLAFMGPREIEETWTPRISISISRPLIAIEEAFFPFVLGMGVSAVVGIIMTATGRLCPAAWVYTSVVLCPVILAGLAVYFLLRSSTSRDYIAPGVITSVLALLTVCWVVCVWRFIPFTVKVFQMITTCMKEHPSVHVIPFLGTAISAIWTVSWGFVVSYACLYYNIVDRSSNQVHRASSSKSHEVTPFGYVVVFFGALALYWGPSTAYNACHTANCGIFGRWYFSAVESSAMKSLGAAFGTSFGSVCKGSFIVSICRALETVARMGRDDTNNIVCCILAQCVICIIQCIGDLIEYVNEWSYVQCAIRGSTYCEAVSITFSLFSFHNMKAIISDTILDTVVTLMVILCVLAGTGICFVFSDVFGASAPFWGFLGSITSGPPIVAVISSGAKSIMTCFTEDGRPLATLMPYMSVTLEERLSDARYVDAGESEMAEKNPERA